MKDEQWAEHVYQRYPRKVAKRRAIKAILSAHKRLTARGSPRLEAWTYLDEMTIQYAESDEGRGNLKLGSNGQCKYVPYPATWFNGDRFDDDPAEWYNPKPRRAVTYDLTQAEAQATQKRLELDKQRENIIAERRANVARVAAMDAEERERLKQMVVARNPASAAVYRAMDPMESPTLCGLMVAELEREAGNGV